MYYGFYKNAAVRWRKKNLLRNSKTSTRKVPLFLLLVINREEWTQVKLKLKSCFWKLLHSKTDLIKFPTAGTLILGKRVDSTFGQNKFLTSAIPQVFCRLLHQSQPGFYHWGHQTNRTKPNRRQLIHLYHWQRAARKAR